MGTAVACQDEDEKNKNVSMPVAMKPHVLDLNAEREVDKGLFRRRTKPRKTSDEGPVNTLGAGDGGLPSPGDGAGNEAEDGKGHKQSTFSGRFWPFFSSSSAVKYRADGTRNPMVVVASNYDNDDEEEDDVIERGYSQEDEAFLHHQQAGRLAGVEAVESKKNRTWATAGLEGRTVRR